MRRVVVACAVVCLSATACGLPTSSGSVESSASCAGPYVETEPRQAQPGEPLTVRGEGHADACYDGDEQRRAQPLDDLPVFFQQGGELTDLGRLDASGPEGSVLTTVTVPADARPGLAQVTVGASEPALVMVGDGRGGYPPWPGPPTGPFELTVALRAMPSFLVGGWVLASATTVDVQVPDADKHVTAVEPLGAEQISFGALFPTYWTVDVRVHRCERSGCPPPTPARTGPACPAEVRILDRPARVAYTHAGEGAGGCALRGIG